MSFDDPYGLDRDPQADGTRMRGGWPTRLGELLQPSLGGLGPRLWTEARLRKAWLETVGEQVASHAQIRRLRGDVLEVAVSSDAWANELTFLAASVIERLNQRLGDGTVSELVVHRRRRERHR